MSNKTTNRLIFPAKLNELVSNGREYTCFKMLQLIYAEETTGKPSDNTSGDNKSSPPKLTQIGENIFLPMPAGFAAGDSASFGEFSGTIATGINKLKESGTAGLSKADELLASMKGLDAITGGVGSDVQDSALSKAGVAFNANTTLKFEGNGIRTYSFAYKLVPSNQEESDTINSIINTFRLASYSKARGLFGLEYPSQFQIRFYVNGTDDNAYYPHIHNCYLTSVEVNYNTEGNIFYVNGAPTAVELSLSFTETRQLTRDDIESRSSIKFNTTPTTRG